MDTTRQPVTNPPEPPELQPATSPQECTGDSDESVRVAGRSSEADDDAESCSGAASWDDGSSNGEVEGAAVMEVDDDASEVDSAMAVPWWRRVGDCPSSNGAPAAEGGGCAAAVAESNRLFWEACIAHGY